MRLMLVCVGRIKAGPERELVARYSERAAAAGRAIGFASLDLREIDESRARRAEERKSEEAKAIRAALGTGTPFVAFDASGDVSPSEEFANRLAALRDGGAGLLGLVIGGPDGLDRVLQSGAQVSIAFGRMTWPHQLARIMAAEQIYRAMTILAGHPYHRA
jgi:23S rRNA (pseudouridine1915-N3)-methyltransferase